MRTKPLSLISVIHEERSQGTKEGKSGKGAASANGGSSPSSEKGGKGGASAKGGSSPTSEKGGKGGKGGDSPPTRPPRTPPPVVVPTSAPTQPSDPLVPYIPLKKPPVPLQQFRPLYTERELYHSGQYTLSGGIFVSAADGKLLIFYFMTELTGSRILPSTIFRGG